MKKILLLGSGELGKEFTIVAKKYGCEVHAVDSYPNAPAMQVTNTSHVIDMKDPVALDNLINEVKPDIIVPEVEAIATSVLYNHEKNGIQIVPSAFAVNCTMQRDEIRNLASNNNIKTAEFAYADDEESCKEYLSLKYVHNRKPLVVKPVMSSSGKGQIIVDSPEKIDIAWKYAMENSRGSIKRVIIEEFIDFAYEVTLLTYFSGYGVGFCDPIIHYQKDGDFKWSSHDQSKFIMDGTCLYAMQRDAEFIVRKLQGGGKGLGLYGVEFFITWDKETNSYTPIFSELSPRPHDTGMVTLRSQNISEFEIHLRCILGLQVPEVKNYGGSCATINSTSPDTGRPNYEEYDENVFYRGEIDFRIFGKEEARPGRRMGILLGDNLENLIDTTKKNHIKIEK